MREDRQARMAAIRHSGRPRWSPRNPDPRLSINNEYGYRYNVNHPQVRALYDQYRAAHGMMHGHPMGDLERWDFERILDDSLFPGWDSIKK